MKTLHRRTFLRGAGGIALTLPFLEIMRPRTARAASSKAPKRLILMTTPNGTVSDLFFPNVSQIGQSDFELSPMLEPLAPYKDKIAVMLGIDNKVVKSGHHDGMCSLYTGRHAISNGHDRTATGISLDQHVARRLAEDPATRTPFSSLVLGTDSKYTSALNNTAYLGKRTPVPKIPNAKSMFDQIFGVTQGQSEAMRRAKRSVLDEVSDDLTKLRGQLGRRDTDRLDLHLNSIRELERRIEFGGRGDFASFVPGGATQHDNALHEMIPQMFDVLALALATDMSRVVNFNVRTEGATSAYTFGWLGIGPEPDPFGHDTTDNSSSTSHHSMSHNERYEHNRTRLTEVGRYFVEEWAGLIERLKGLEEEEGSVFDNTVMLAGSPIARGLHWTNDMPFLVMGDAGGRLKTGQYLNLRTDGSTDFGKPDEDPKTHVHDWGRFKTTQFRGVSHNNLLLTLLHAMGFEDETSFGDPDHCDGPIDALLA